MAHKYFTITRNMFLTVTPQTFSLCIFAAKEAAEYSQITYLILSGKPTLR